MTPDERNLLNDLAAKIAQTPTPPKDPEAEDFIRTHIGNRPDALYLMTQTVLVQNLALQHAQQQIQDLQRSAPGQIGSGTSFLGGGANPTYAQNRPQYAAPAPPPPQYAPQYAPPASGGGGSFLRGAAQTATGVVAGTLAAEAIGSLFHQGGGGMFGGGGGLFGGGSGAPAEEVVNNYYETPHGNDPGGFNDQNVNDRNVNDQPYVDNSQYENTADDSSFTDDSSFDDNSGGDYNV